jgi:hypothetical protein
MFQSILLLSLLLATDNTHATRAGQYKPALPSHMIIVCTVSYKVCAYFEMFSKSLFRKYLALYGLNVLKIAFCLNGL